MDKNKQHILDTIFKMYPKADCELHFKTPVQLAIAVILSAQTTDVAVNKVTPSLFAKFKTLSDLAEAPIEEIEKTIQKIGLYRNKAKHIQEFAQQVLQRHEGVLPSDFESLVQLSGIGRKTANVIQAVAFHIPALAVDTHVERVAHRLGLVTQKADVYQTELQLKRLIAKPHWIQAHHSILFFGRYHCLSRQPKCAQCPLYDLCRFKQKEVFYKKGS